MSKFTKKAIVSSFLKLLNNKPMDKITVKDIIEDCEVNRSTFYYYFENVYDCLLYVFEEEAKRFSESHLHYNDWLDGIVEAMSFAMENRRAVYHIYKSVNREELENYLSTVFDMILQDIVEKNSADFLGDLQVSERDIILIIDMYKYGFIGLIFKWLREGMPGEPIDNMYRLSIMLDGNIRSMLEKAAEN